MCSSQFNLTRMFLNSLVACSQGLMILFHLLVNCLRVVWIDCLNPFLFLWGRDFSTCLCQHTRTRCHLVLSCHVWRQTVRWGGADTWRLTSVSRQTWRQTIFFWKKKFPIFFGEKMKKKFSEKRATRRQQRQSICLPYTTGGMHSQNKHNRHTDSRFRLLEDNSPRDGRGS